jgi:hypothetical protein
MTFVALHKDTRERIDITLYPFPKKEALKQYALICQVCGEELFIKEGEVKAAHFAHKAGSHCGSDGETLAHKDGKLFLKKQLVQVFPEYIEAAFYLEYQVPEIGRIIDLLTVFPDGRKIAHEVQLSPITTRELMERTRDYKKVGIEVVWWLGKSAHTETNKNWCFQQFHRCCLIRFRENVAEKIEVLKQPTPVKHEAISVEKEFPTPAAPIKVKVDRAPLTDDFSVWDRSHITGNGVVQDFDVAIWIHWPSLFCEYTDVIQAKDCQQAVEILMRKEHILYAERVAVRATTGGKVHRYQHLRLAQRGVKG